MSRRPYSAKEVREILIRDVDSEDESSDNNFDNSSAEDIIISDLSQSSSAEGSSAETDTEQTSRGRGRSRGRTSTRNGNRGRAPARRCRSRNAVSTVTSTRNSGNDDADYSPAAADDLTFQAKDGTFWYKEARRQPVGRQTAANIMPTAPGPTKYAIRNVATPADAFQLYMRSAIFKEVLNWTNKEGYGSMERSGTMFQMAN